MCIRVCVCVYLSIYLSIYIYIYIYNYKYMAWCVSHCILTTRQDWVKPGLAGIEAPGSVKLVGAGFFTA